jgi:hypothetical protein
MIRVYLAIFLLGITGASFLAFPFPVLHPVGVIDLVIAALAAHAHFTQE